MEPPLQPTSTLTNAISNPIRTFTRGLPLGRAGRRRPCSLLVYLSNRSFGLSSRWSCSPEAPTRYESLPERKKQCPPPIFVRRRASFPPRLFPLFLDSTRR